MTAALNTVMHGNNDYQDGQGSPSMGKYIWMMVACAMVFAPATPSALEIDQNPTNERLGHSLKKKA